MNILITGANGFLGQHLCRVLKDKYTVFATARGVNRIPFDAIKFLEADITQKENINKIVQQTKPDVIIHTAAMSKPDECNAEKKLCDAINIEGTRIIVEAAEALQTAPHIIYISTDFVFGDGGPHDENAIPAPLNYYGESKLKAEKIVETCKPGAAIVRPVFIYGETWEGVRPTFLHWVSQSLKEQKFIKVVNDQKRTPAYVKDICKGIETIIIKRAEGIYHLAGKERVSPYEMAIRFAEILQLDTTLIQPVTEKNFKEPVRRAKEGGLIIDKAIRELNYSPVNLEQGLRCIAASLDAG